jgi:hypothetical protein
MEYSIECYSYNLIIVLITFGYSCKKDTYVPPDITTPTLITREISNVIQTTAVSGGEIINDGGSVVISRGVCWNTEQNPTILDFHTSDGQGTDTCYTSVLTELSPETKYFVRAYATNSFGTSYGEQLALLQFHLVKLPMSMGMFTKL